MSRFSSMPKLPLVLTCATLILFSGGCFEGSSVNGSPPTFNDQIVVKGLNSPSALKFTKSGSFFVGEKSGVIKYFKDLNDKQPAKVLDIREKVHNYWDRGFMSIEVDPRFPSVPTVWVLYTFDGPIGGAASTYGDEDNRPRGPASARLSKFDVVADAQGRYTAGPEQVVIHDWCQVFPSHSVGHVQFGPDGALYVSAGDAASFSATDWGQFENFCGDPVNEGGALRSQDLLTSGDPTSLDGTILRIDPITGQGLATNPLYGGAKTDDDRIISYGLRNPYRFTFRPGTQELWVGDVGWDSWEEINRISDPNQLTNFGWPCFEGMNPHPKYAETDLCKMLYVTTETQPSAVTSPHYTYKHGKNSKNPNPCTGSGGAITGLAFYEGGDYPDDYVGALFIADYSRNCIWVQFPDDDGVPTAEGQEIVLSNASGPLDLQVGPGGDLFYVSINDGTIRRIRYLHPEVVETPDSDARAPIPTILVPSTDIEAAPNTPVAFQGSATDADGKPLDASALSWKIQAIHCQIDDPTDCHVHTILEQEGVAAGSFIMNGDHEDPSYVLIRLTATVVEGQKIHTRDATVRVNYPTP